MISKHFKLESFIPPDLIKVFGQNSVEFLDPVLISLADFVCDFFRANVTINNWSSGGNLSLRGFRPPDTTTGAKYSQHKFGRAMDINVEGKTPVEVYDIILANEKQFMNAGLTVMEDSRFCPTWTHIDIRYTGNDFIRIVKP